jgi:hypothetical protein
LTVPALSSLISSINNSQTEGTGRRNKKKRIMKKSFLVVSFLLVAFLVSCSKEDHVDDHSRAHAYTKEFVIIKNTLNYYRSNQENFGFVKDRNLHPDSVKWGLTRIQSDENGKSILSVPISSDLAEDVRYLLNIAVDEQGSIEHIYFVECKPSSDYYMENSEMLFFQLFFRYS